MIQFLSMDNVILQYLYKKWKTEESEMIENIEGIDHDNTSHNNQK